MNYEITERGIRYIIEDLAPPDLPRESVVEAPPIPDDEAVKACQEISARYHEFFRRWDERADQGR